MAKDKPKARIYVESPAIIDLVKFKVGASTDPDRERDVWHLQRMLEAARDDRVEVFTSTISIAECTHVRDPAREEEARKFFYGLLASGHGGFKLAQPTMTIMEKARDLRWIHSIPLRGLDAAHAATALHFQCQEFWSHDGKIMNAAAGFAAMGLRVCTPKETACLPDEYRQDDLEI